MLTSGTISTLKSKAREKKLKSVCNGVAVTALVFTCESWVGTQDIKMLRY
jgi:hypothetical protein